jgi:hypothetical protein
MTGVELIVHNLPRSATVDSVVTLFSLGELCGVVLDALVRSKFDRHGHQQFFAFVAFFTVEFRDRAIAMLNYTKLDGSEVCLG